MSKKQAPNKSLATRDGRSSSAFAVGVMELLAGASSKNSRLTRYEHEDIVGNDHEI
jgi:hypothetical protein